MATVQGSGTGLGEPGVRGDSTQDDGVVGFTRSTGHAGVAGVNDEGRGSGIFGHSRRGDGVFAESAELRGVMGTSKSTAGHAGVAGVNDEGLGPGVFGRSSRTDGVSGECQGGNGVHGRGATGGSFEGRTIGLRAVAEPGRGGTALIATGPGGVGDDFAGFFEGNVRVNKSITTTDVLILGADCAEDFETLSSAHIEPGTVMSIGDDARLVESDRAYDKRVAGIVSGAGDYKPGIVLGKDAFGKDASRKDRVPLALVGRVFCKTDATYAPIEVGDLLTTSPTQGHAMRAEDPLKAFGAVIGKALAPLREGRSLLPILVALQ